jgi:hypothetical protein
MAIRSLPAYWVPLGRCFAAAAVNAAPAIGPLTTAATLCRSAEDADIGRKAPALTWIMLSQRRLTA